MRIGQHLEYWGHVANDANEPMPFDFSMRGNGPVNATWTYDPNYAQAVNWRVEWVPDANQAGTHEFIVTVEDQDKLVQATKTKVVIVHPAKMPPVITQDGCNVF